MRAMLPASAMTSATTISTVPGQRSSIGAVAGGMNFSSRRNM